ncbi:hypothetical protein ACX40Y_17180 [Sphingomonas sp. RS6]
MLTQSASLRELSDAEIDSVAGGAQDVPAEVADNVPVDYAYDPSIKKFDFHVNIEGNNGGYADFSGSFNGLENFRLENLGVEVGNNGFSSSMNYNIQKDTFRMDTTYTVANVNGYDVSITFFAGSQPGEIGFVAKLKKNGQN